MLGLSDFFLKAITQPVMSAPRMSSAMSRTMAMGKMDDDMGFICYVEEDFGTDRLEVLVDCLST